MFLYLISYSVGVMLELSSVFGCRKTYYLGSILIIVIFPCIAKRVKVINKQLVDEIVKSLEL